MKRTALLYTFPFLTFVVFVANLSTGSVNLALADTFAALTGGEVSEMAKTIVWDMRLPKALTAMLAGAALSVAGLVMQTLFRNPLAGPYVLGISSGASLGVAVMMLAAGSTGLEIFDSAGYFRGLGPAAAGVLGAGVVMLLILSLASRVGMLTLLLAGLVIGYVAGALSNILVYLSVPERVQAYVAWTYGHFGDVGWNDLNLLASASVVGVLMVLNFLKPLNALMLGEAYAESVGVHVARARVWLLAAATLMTGAITAFCGPIGFIGVAAPHICRGLLKTSDHRFLVPASLMCGAVLAMTADMIASVPGSSLLLPLNSVTALIGAPVIIFVLLRARNYRRNFGE